MSTEPGEVKDHYLYFDISKHERDSAIRYLLGIIVNTRQESNFPSNYYVYDEDVNVYLAHLLFAVSLPQYHEMARPYLSLDSSEILRWIRATDDRTIRYFIFKVNADHILVHTAVFEDLEKQNNIHKILQRTPKHYQELAKLYYEQATAYHRRMYRRQTGVGEVLKKVSDYFECYQTLLKRVRKEYFNFLNSFRDQAFRHFVINLKHYEVEIRCRQLMDQFLDVYGKWLSTKDPKLVGPVMEISEELKRLDPAFQFDPDRQLFGKGEADERLCA